MKQILKITFLVGAILFPLFLSAQDSQTNNATISGKVLDSRTNEALIGATVTIKGTTNGSVTDANGEFSLITAQKLPFTLIVSYVGYVRKEVLTKGSGVEIKLDLNNTQLDDVVISSRRRQESAQEVPIPISVISGTRAEDAGAFNVNRLKELVPTVQLYASNARNTTLNIRGLGSTFGLTNDGVDPGVGFYVDGVYYARPAATALDFIDIERVEVLRGPQGTLFGKNTTAGAFNITTRAASFTPGANVEASYGNLGFVQAKVSLTGPISKKLAARVSFTGTQRNGTFYNIHTQLPINDINNIGVRGQILYTPNENINITVIGDVSDQKPNGYGWPVAGVVPTKRAAYRQFNAIIADLGYTLPYKSAFERKLDLDTPSKADNRLGGVSVNADIKLGKGTLTSTSAWRFWKWTPLNDRDYIGLPVFTISSGNSAHDQWSQEIRYSGKISPKLSGVVGVFGLWQDLKSDPVQTEEAGSAQWRFAQSSTSALWKTPGLFDNFGIRTTNRIKSTSLAVFAQADWVVTNKFHILPGIRYNYDKKVVDYKRETYGGLQTTDPALIALKNGVYTNQAFNTDYSEGNFSGQLSLQYKASTNLNAYATYSVGYKPIGVNVGGLPTANGQNLIDLAKVKPEYVDHKEFGVKTKPSANSVLNLTIYRSDIKDYQTQVQTPEPGVNRGYLANAEKVRVQGAEVDGNIRLKHFTFNAAIAYTDGKYVRFANAPVPLEEVGGAQAFKDISGGRLPGISKWSGSVGGEVVVKGSLISLKGNYFLGIDEFLRSEFSSSPSPSQYLNIGGYGLTNARLGFRASNGLSLYVWGRNIFNKNYYEQLLAAPGSYGQYAGIVGDQRTYGVTVRFTY
ncbi:TonB-dependent receptor [Dyadobacter frigoris]|uniref:TonB-dependent receptor n=1 Tax=Dyadobacter frigoris TaxID=2576211 RepID=A0A4U6CZI1_9BACT|nr:TonB-dependent receptor [Dyadobacter frigoris]TKT88798.1 TonB-dependent receptor [Dyadobacter frigoris]GLU53995.1 TonB-dependent receptor [Dyadobacter frigoris]